MVDGYKSKVVLHLFNEINYSGAELMYASAAYIFQDNGYSLMAFNTGNRVGDFVSVFETNKIKVFYKPISFNKFTFKYFKYYFDLYGFIKDNKVDVLHIHRSDLVFAGVVAWLANVKCIKTQHNVFKNRSFTLPYAICWRFMLRRLFNVVFQTIGNSVYNNELGFFKNESVKVNNWFNSDKFYPVINDKEKFKIRSKLGIPNDAFVIISTGACSHVKNHQDIVKSLQVVSKKIDCVYLHLGCGSIIDEEQKLAIDLGVDKNIYYLGNKDNVRDYLVASDLFVMPSKFEGLSIAAIEAMACGLPVILYDVPGLRDLVFENNNGYLISPSYEQLANTILHCYYSRLEIKQKSNNALVFVNHEFEMVNNVEKIINLYES